MASRKYGRGDFVHGALLLEDLPDKLRRDRVTGRRVALWRCAYCKNMFERRVDKVSAGRNSCGCKHIKPLNEIKSSTRGSESRNRGAGKKRKFRIFGFDIVIFKS